MITYPDILPFKLRFLRALTAALKEITPDNGYFFDLADFDPGDGVATSRIYRGRAMFGEHDPIPMVSILEGTNPADEVGEPPVNATTGAYDWHLLIQGFVDDDPTNPTDPAYLLLADVRQRLAVEAVRRGQIERTPDPLGLGSGLKNRAEKLIIGPGVVRPADDVSAKAYFWLTLGVRIVESAAAPYA